MIRLVKSIIPERYKGPLLAKLKPSSHPDLEEWKGRKKVVIALAGFYQNLGDMALTYSHMLFIKKVLPDYEVLFFSSAHTYSRMKALKRVVGPNDIITTVGGGNMDDIYSSLENARRYVVRSFAGYPVISFPQTMDFSQSPAGRRALERSARTYGAHDRLTLFGREPMSIELMKAGFPNVQVEGCPDIALSLAPQLPAQEREGAMLTIRDDKEALLTSAERAMIRSVLEMRTDDIIVKDTVDVAYEDCQPDKFVETLHDFWKLLSTRRVVVTDRLHCMIFCVITRTPVVVLSNSNHKIRGTYEAWLKEYSYVRYLDSFDAHTLSEAVDQMWNLRPDEVTGPDLAPHYDSLRRGLLEAAGRPV